MSKTEKSTTFQSLLLGGSLAALGGCATSPNDTRAPAPLVQAAIVAPETVPAHPPTAAPNAQIERDGFELVRNDNSDVTLKLYTDTLQGRQIDHVVITPHKLVVNYVDGLTVKKEFNLKDKSIPTDVKVEVIADKNARPQVWLALDNIFVDRDLRVSITKAPDLTMIPLSIEQVETGKNTVINQTKATLAVLDASATQVEMLKKEMLKAKTSARTRIDVDESLSIESKDGLVSIPGAGRVLGSEARSR